MEFPQFEFIIKRIFYFFLLLIVFALAAVFWFMFDVFLFWKYTPLSEWSPLGRVLWMTFSVLTTIASTSLFRKKSDIAPHNSAFPCIEARTMER